jgi:DNA polymerase
MSTDPKLKNINNALKKKFQGKKLVFGDGAADASIVFVGEAPGIDEEKEGKPITGLSEKLLNQMLKSVGIDKKKVYHTNVLKYCPSKTKVPTSKEIRSYAPFLKEEIKTINPRVVVTLGNMALTGIGLRQPLDNVHGKVFRMGTYELLPTVHPIAALKNPDHKVILAADFMKLKELLGKEREV